MVFVVFVFDVQWSSGFSLGDSLRRMGEKIFKVSSLMTQDGTNSNSLFHLQHTYHIDRTIGDAMWTMTTTDACK